MRNPFCWLHFFVRDMTRPLHFTIGTGLGLNPSVGQLSLENDLLMVKAGLLYADRVRLCSIGASLALEFAKLMKASGRERMEFLGKYFEDLAPSNPEAATTMREFVAMYRDLQGRRGGTRSQAQIQTMFEVQANMRRTWTEFEKGIGEFLRIAGADGIVEAVDTGLLDVHRFDAGGVERMGGLDQEDQDRREEEFVADLFWEFLDLIGDAVADGDTNPLFDQMSGGLLRTGVEAGVVSTSESGIDRGKHSGLASDLLRQLPLFEEATVKDILGIRRELENPLIRFRGAVMGMSDDIRSAAWDPDFPSDVDKEFRKVVEPAVLEIEEAVQENASLRALLLKGFRPGDWATGLGVTISTLAGLPAAASVLLGSGTTASMMARGAYKEWLQDRKNMESNHMFFYYETRERLAALDSASATTTALIRGAKQEALEAEPEALEPGSQAEGASQVDDAPSDAEREAQEFMDENEDLLDEGGYATLQRLLTQGFNVSKDLTIELAETARLYAPARRALNEAMKNPNTRPRRIYELEREVEQLEPVYKRKKRLNDEFDKFLDRAKSAYEREGGTLADD